MTNRECYCFRLSKDWILFRNVPSTNRSCRIKVSTRRARFPWIEFSYLIGVTKVCPTQVSRAKVPDLFGSFFAFSDDIIGRNKMHVWTCHQTSARHSFEGLLTPILMFSSLVFLYSVLFFGEHQSRSSQKCFRLIKLTTSQLLISLTSS